MVNIMSSSMCTMMLITAILLAGFVNAVDPPKPLWHRKFAVEFNETTKILFTSRMRGTWWYDAINGLEVIERSDGRGDRYCGSVHPFSHTKCRHVVKEGKRYLVFPDMDDCCFCCDAKRGCGILSPDWLSTATFEGETELRGMKVYKWNAKGLQPNYYYATADPLQLPVELDQIPNDLQSFDVSTFGLRSIPERLLHIPENCREKCPITSICTFLNAPDLEPVERDEMASA